MRQLGSEIKCDRCGNTVFQVTKDSWYEMPPGWGKGFGGCDLCNECYEVFTWLIDDFMKGYPKHDDKLP